MLRYVEPGYSFIIRRLCSSVVEESTLGLADLSYFRERGGEVVLPASYTEVLREQWQGVVSLDSCYNARRPPGHLLRDVRL